MAKRRKHGDDEEGNDEEEKKEAHIKKKMKKSKKAKENGGEESDDVVVPTQDDEHHAQDSEGEKEKENSNLAWTEEEMRKLIERMEAQIPKDDVLNFSTRATKIDWEQVKFEPFSASDCSLKWREMLSKQRTFRLLSEVLQDCREWVKKPWTDFHKPKAAKHHPGMPPRPLSSYMLFYSDKKEKIKSKHPNLTMPELSKIIGVKFKALPEEKKEKYKMKALQEKEEYEAKLQEFYSLYPNEISKEKKKNPKTKQTEYDPLKPIAPFKLFYDSKVNKHKDDPDFNAKKLLVKCREQWKNMSDKKKCVWIKWTAEREQEYLAALASENQIYEKPKSILTKEEKAILDRMSGKPSKPPNSAYALFTTECMRAGGEMKSFKVISEMWRKMADSEKQEYNERVKELQEQYKLKYADYLNSLSEEKRLEELENAKPARKAKNKLPVEDKVQQTKISEWVTKKKASVNENTKSNLYKNEPPHPPGNVFDYYCEKLRKAKPDLDKKTLLHKAKTRWQTLSHENKKVFEDELRALKKKYIKEYKTFLKNLTEKELGEYSVMRNPQMKSDVTKKSDSNSAPSSSGEDDGDDDDEEDNSDDDDDGGGGGNENLSSENNEDSEGDSTSSSD